MDDLKRGIQRVPVVGTKSSKDIYVEEPSIIHSSRFQKTTQMQDVHTEVENLTRLLAERD